jgi:hypothetical protein
MAFLAKNDKLIGIIRPRICVTIGKMMNLKFVPFIRKTTATIMTGKVPLFDESIGIPLPIWRL